MGCSPGEMAMVGDDVVSDVEGAIGAGLRGILVQTGKYRSGDEDRIGSPETFLARDIVTAVDTVLAGS